MGEPIRPQRLTSEWSDSGEDEPIQFTVKSDLSDIHATPQSVYVAHCKGFNNIFTQFKELSLKNEMVSDLAQRIVGHIIKQSVEMQVLLVYDGDDLHADQWTIVLPEVVRSLQQKKKTVSLVTCRQMGGDWGSSSCKEYLDQMAMHFLLEKPTDLYFYTYGEGPENSNKLDNSSYMDQRYPKDYLEVGKFLFHLTCTSGFHKVDVICIGGGATPLDELKYTQGKDEALNSVIGLGSAKTKPEWFLVNYPSILTRVQKDKEPEQTALLQKDGCTPIEGVKLI